MAEDYQVTFQVRYLDDGSQADTFTDDIGSADTDDGFWNDGDLLEPTSFFQFAGYYEDNGHTFLVFEDRGIGGPPTGEVLIASPTAPLIQFPATFEIGDIALTTTQIATCFAPGTSIATPQGEQAVESLEIGDLVHTVDGRTTPVKWIGRQTILPRFGPAERLMPVRFTAGSLGDGLPHFDLTVTADHAMLVEGILCNASALVNGATITRVPLAEMGERFTVYHIETENHEIVLANGAPAETFIDNVSRRVFDNYDEFETLYGDVPEMQELPYPRAMSARQVPSHVKTKLGLTDAA